MKNSKEIVLHSVLDMLETTSVFEISMSDLKKKTGLSTGTVYYHYPNGIEDVFRSIFIELATELREILFTRAKKEQSFEKTLEEVITVYFNWHRTETRKSNFFYSISASGFKDLRNLLISQFNVFSSGIYKVLRERAQEEDVKIVEPIILDSILFGAARELIHSWINRGRNKEEFDDLVSQFICALKRACVV